MGNRAAGFLGVGRLIFARRFSIGDGADLILGAFAFASEVFEFAVVAFGELRAVGVARHGVVGNRAAGFLGVGRLIFARRFSIGDGADLILGAFAFASEVFEFAVVAFGELRAVGVARHGVVGNRAAGFLGVVRRTIVATRESNNTCQSYHSKEFLVHSRSYREFRVSQKRIRVSQKRSDESNFNTHCTLMPHTIKTYM